MKVYFGIAVVVLLMACNGTAQKATGSKDTVSVKDVAVDDASRPTFKDEKVALIYTEYLKLKDDLVATKFEESKVSAKSLSASLKGYAGCENTAVIATKIENAKDISVQRAEFTSLSADVIALFKHAAVTNGTIYVQHCPMANNGNGGDWLASEKKIQNPYYGSEMMECGAVIEEIVAK